MNGWIIPPPKKPSKTKEEFKKERQNKVSWLIDQGYLRSEDIKQAMLKVEREEFIPDEYRDYAYLEVPFPLPGIKATISCPHSYPLFYEALRLVKGDRFLEVGLGSGYGYALAREIVGSDGLVVSIEIDPLTIDFAKKNLEDRGYRDIVVVQGDGNFGYPELAPYDKICVTAACDEIPPSLVEQLEMGGRLIAPVKKERSKAQDLVLLEKTKQRVRKAVFCEVLYVSLQKSPQLRDR